MPRRRCSPSAVRRVPRDGSAAPAARPGVRASTVNLLQPSGVGSFARATSLRSRVPGVVALGVFRGQVELGHNREASSTPTSVQIEWPHAAQCERPRMPGRRAAVQPSQLPHRPSASQVEIPQLGQASGRYRTPATLTPSRQCRHAYTTDWPGLGVVAGPVADTNTRMCSIGEPCCRDPNEMTVPQDRCQRETGFGGFSDRKDRSQRGIRTPSAMGTAWSRGPGRRSPRRPHRPRRPGSRRRPAVPFW